MCMRRVNWEIGVEERERVSKKKIERKKIKERIREEKGS